MARRNPSGNLPSDRTPDRAVGAPERDGIKTDMLALKCRELSPEERAAEAALVRRCVGRVRVDGDPDETAIVRTELRSMLLGEA